MKNAATSMPASRYSWVGAHALVDRDLLAHQVERRLVPGLESEVDPAAARRLHDRAVGGPIPLARERQVHVIPSGAMRRQNASR